MTKKFVDCFMIMGTALSLRSPIKLPEIGRPVLRDFITTNVNISLSVQELKIINHNNLEVELTALLNQQWIDPRLGANAKTRKMAVAGQIWKPKIININGENRICNNEDAVFWRGFGDEGNVVLSEKVIIKTTCTKNYRKFPFDSQMCDFKFGTYRFPQDEVAIAWNPVPLYITTNINFNEFNVTNIVTYVEIDIRSFGDFSTAVVQFVFKRHIQHYIYCLMLPPFLLALVNYAPFWFNLNQRTSRLTINTSVLLLTIYLSFCSQCSVHPTPYLKASDVFVLICTLFSIITLVETVFVDFVCTLEETQFHLKKVACSREYPTNVLWVEQAMKLSYPVFYIFFLILYGWLYN